MIYSPATQGAFEFTGPATPPYHLDFARKLAHLCQERGTRLVVLYLPQFNERGQAVIRQRCLWSAEFSAPVDLVGVPPKKLFAGIPEADISKLYYNAPHMNQNGQEFFTAIITPALLKLYAATTNQFR